MSNYIYLRGLRQVNYTVFSVSDGQKNYYDPMYGRVAFSSGQQVKRSIITAALDDMNVQIAPIKFNYNLKNEKGGKKKVTEGEALSISDPSYPDQLLGGWMNAAKDASPVKRRSPLSISAMRPLHPSLSTIHSENMTFDRSSHHGIHEVIVKDDSGNEIDPAVLKEFLETNQRTLPARKFLQDQKRTGGLFVYDVAIDLRTLFSVSLNVNEPEITEEVANGLREKGWIEGQNAFGTCLICPAEQREKMIPALAKALVDWKITTNQSRTYDLMQTLAVAVSQNANRIAATIRAKLVEERKARPIIDTQINGAEVFVTLPAEGYILGVEGNMDALEQAEKHLIDLMMAFDYENQMA